MWNRFILLAVMFPLLAFATITQAQRPDAPAFAVRGPYAVGTRDFTIEDNERPLMVTVWYPALNPDSIEEIATYSSGLVLTATGHAIRNAKLNNSDAPYPLIVFSHGSGGFRFQSLFYTEHLASYGFVVMAADHPGNTILDRLNLADFVKTIPPSYIYRPEDVLRQIAYAEQLNAPNGELAGLIDMQRIGVTGHSFGGYTALAAGGASLNFNALSTWCDSNRSLDSGEENLTYNVCFLRNYANALAALRGQDVVPQDAWPSIADSRIKAVVALAPWNGPILQHESLSLPTMLIVGSADSITLPERDAYRIYETVVSAPKTLIVLENADHFVFVDACTQTAIDLGFFSSCSDQVWDMARAHDLINHFATAFLLAQLKGDTTAARELKPERVDFRGIEYRTEGR